MANETTTPVNDDLKAQALAGLKERLANAGLQDIEVELGWGLGDLYNDKPQETLQINFTSTAIEKSPETADEIKARIYEVLQANDIFRKHIEFDDPIAHVENLRATLQEFIDRGAQIPKEYLEWRGFNTELVKEKKYFDNLPDHAINLDYSEGLSPHGSTGINFELAIPETKKEREQGTALADALREKVTGNITARIPAIKEMIAKRLASSKYLGDEMSAEDIQKQVNSLIITVKDATIFIASPDQEKESDRLKDPKAIPLTEEEQKKLAATNILSKLPKEKLGKILGRAFLHAGDKAEEIFPLVAAREDMKRAITRQLKIFKYSEAGQKDPELQKTVDEFIADDAFKKQDYDADKAQFKATPHPIKDADPKKSGTMSINITFEKKGIVQDLLTALAEPPQQQEQSATPETPAAETSTIAAEDKGWAAKFAKDAEKKLAPNDPAATPSATERLAQEEPAAVGAAR